MSESLREDLEVGINPDGTFTDEVIPEDDIEPSEEEIALSHLDKEHYEDYQAIRRAVSRTDLAERLVDMAVLAGKRERSQNKLGL